MNGDRFKAEKTKGLVELLSEVWRSPNNFSTSQGERRKSRFPSSSKGTDFKPAAAAILETNPEG